MPDVNRLLDGLRLGEPQGRSKLQLVPLIKVEPTRLHLDYVLVEEALARGLLNIIEEGRVGEVRVSSSTDSHTLLLAGEELAGAWQDRILNVDVLLRPRGNTTIPVSCIEKGRWAGSSTSFMAGMYGPPMVRAVTTQSVGRNLLASSAACSDQQAVWAAVDTLLTRTGSISGSRAMSAIFPQHQSALDLLLNGLRCPANAVGVIAVVNGEFAAVDIFDRPSTLSQIWRRLTQAYAAHALILPTLMGSQSAIKTAAVMQCLRSADATIFNGVDRGEDWRIETRDFIGSALVVDGAMVHLSAFPNNSAGEFSAGKRKSRR